MAKASKYLGDGAYADFDGYGVEVWTERDGDRHYVFLEPSAWLALAKFVADQTTFPFPDIDDTRR